MSLLFTGHKGFLGRELIPNLRLLDEVVLFDGDLTNFRELQSYAQKQSVTRIIHAAVRGGRRNKIDSQEILVNNVQATTNVLNLDLPTVLFCSGAIYNRDFSINCAKEDESLSSFPNDYYGQSKFVSTALARNRAGCNILRFFNVFGPTEGMDRFISYNISQYIKRKPMKVFSDFEMDFFYVADTLAVLTKWLRGDDLPSELNMVYPEKFRLSEICETINGLANHSVPIEIEQPPKNRNYTGSGQRLSSMNLPLLGLIHGLRQMYFEFEKS